MNVVEAYNPKSISASGVVIPAAGGTLGGFFCTTGGNIQLRDGITGASPVVVSTFTVVPGQFYVLPFTFPNGCYVDIAGGAVGTFGYIQLGALKMLLKWAASLGALALSLDFTSGSLDPRITFTRASGATYYNSAGTLTTAATDTPRFDYDPNTLQALST